MTAEDFKIEVARFYLELGGPKPPLKAEMHPQTFSEILASCRGCEGLDFPDRKRTVFMNVEILKSANMPVGEVNISVLTPLRS